MATEIEGVDEVIVNIIKEIIEQRDLLNREIDFKNQQISDLEEKTNHHHLYNVLSYSGFISELKKKQFYCIENEITMSLLLIKMDNYASVRREYGIMGCESVLSSIASHIMEVAKDTDVVGYAYDYTFGMLIPFMNKEEAQVFSANLVSKINRSEVRFKGKNILTKIVTVCNQLQGEDVIDFLYQTELLFSNRR